MSDDKKMPLFVRAIIQNEKGQILLVKDKKWSWNFPGGKLESGETAFQAAKRETFEETNLVVADLAKVGESTFLFNEGGDKNQYWKGYFYYTNKYSGEIKNKEPSKILDIKFVDYHSEEVNDLIQKTRRFFHNSDDYTKPLKEIMKSK